MRHLPMRRVLLAALVLVLGLVFAGAAGATNYVVLFAGKSVPASASSRIQQAGGTIVASYGQIGVVIAKSDSGAFRGKLMKNVDIENVSSTAGLAVRLDNSSGPGNGDKPNVPATDGDTFSGLQWDMRQIHTPEAHAITGGSPSVLVGDIDTGIDFSHPDLAPNIDVGASANCLSGAPVAGRAAQDDNGHGTHTAGTIAAASNGIGIVGVAPNVRIAGIKAGNADGFFFPEAVICAFMWAGSHHMDVTNNSYFADPYYFNCRNDPTQRAIWKGEARAIQYAQQQGVLVVAAEGNFADDLAHPTQDVTSPDDTTPVVRPVTNACVVIPVEIPGVVGVTADGHNQQANGGYLKSFYSSYGVGSANVVAPGGDSLFGVNAEAVNGRVLSTWPADIPCAPDRKLVDTSVTPPAVYCYAQGTSMASPHATGVAALIASQFGHMRRGQLAAMLEQTGDPQTCPSSLPPGYSDFVSVNNGAPQICQGGAGYNSWYGKGQVNALSAVTHAP